MMTAMTQAMLFLALLVTRVCSGLYIFHDTARPLQVVAAKELQRHIYAASRGDNLPSLADVSHIANALNSGDSPADVPHFVLLRNNASYQVHTSNAGLLAGPCKSDHCVQFQAEQNAVVLQAQTDVQLLHGVYSLLERVGIRFYLHGDVVPSSLYGSLSARLKSVRLEASPTFSTRGLQPFHDFASGPDWWTADDYKAITSQLSKMKMNFIGLHTYPYSSKQGTGTNEPTVWVGLKSQILANGTVTGAYPTSYANTLRPEWGMSAMNTSDFAFGADQIFSDDCFGSPIQKGACPYPTTEAASAQVFEATGDLLNKSFTHARAIGVKTCVGTETPLSKPNPPGILVPLNLYYSASRKDHFLTTTDCAECEGVYDFVRIEGYVYSSPCDGCIALNTYYNGVVQDNALAPSAPSKGYAFVRTEGYALPNSTSSMSQGNTTILDAYYNANVHDTYCTGTEAGKAEAQKEGYALQGQIAIVGVNGTNITTQDFYEGIFTRIMGRYPIDTYWIWTPEGWEWQKMTSKDPVFQQAVSDLNAALQAHDAVQAPFDLATCGWVLGPLPNRSIFDEVLDKRFAAITSIDMDVGNTPVDPSYAEVTRHNKWAIPWMEDDPGLTAPELWVNRTLMHMEDAHKYGCQGLLGIHWRTKATSPQISAMAEKSWNFTLQSEDFWLDFCTAQFGPDAGPKAAAVFAQIESFNLPRPVNWIGGPGGMQADKSQCDQAQTKYGFVDQFQSLLSLATDPDDHSRLLYWVNTFLYMRQIARFECAWSQASSGSKVNVNDDNLVANASAMVTYLLQTVDTRGEMGTVRNVFAHSLIKAIYGKGAPSLSKAYNGPTRITVPTIRTIAYETEGTFDVEVLTMSNQTHAVSAVTMYTRELGAQSFKQVSLKRVASDRGVFLASLDISQLSPNGNSFEYYLLASTQSPSGAGGQDIPWPAGAPTTTQTVTVVEKLG